MKTFLTILALITLVFTLYVGFMGKHSVMGVGFVAFFALLFFANLDKISEVSAGISGFKAKTHEVNKVIGEAKSTISDLQLLTKVVASATLTMVQKGKRIGGLSDEEEDNLKDSILNLLTSVHPAT